MTTMSSFARSGLCLRMIKQNTIVYILCLFATVLCSGGITVISQSGPGLKMGSLTASLAATSYALRIPNTTAQWIWDSTGGVTSTCNTIIRFNHTITPICLGEQVIVTGAAEDIMYVKISGHDFFNYKKDSTQSVNVGTSGMTCGQTLTAQITVTDLPPLFNLFGKCSTTNPGGFIFAVYHPVACGPPSGYFYNTSTCTNSYCMTFIPGCITCTSSTVCTSCDNSKNWLMSGTVCVCKAGFTWPVGCTSCVTSGSACPSCDAISNFASDGAGGCKCKAGYALVGTFCTPCSQVLSNCVSCSSSTVCTQCNSNTLVPISGICRTCATALSNCATCSSTSVCLTCTSASYIIRSNVCTSCASLISGCSQCSSTTNCLVCNTAGNYVKSGSICVPSPGYIETSFGVSVTCASQIAGCTACSSSSTCTTCGGSHFTLNSPNCECMTGYYYDSATRSCLSCSSAKPGCTTCSSSSSCSACDTANHYTLSGSDCACASTYASDGTQCRLCSYFMPGCTDCSSSSVCTSIQSGYFLRGDNNQPQLCTATMNGCSSCTSDSACTGCDTNNHFTDPGNQTCVCASGYTLVVSNCQACTVTLPGCAVCSDTSICTSCLNTHLINPQNTCDSCSSQFNGCSQCNATSCTLCNSQLNFQSDGGTGCTCIPSYSYPQGSNCEDCSAQMTGCRTCDNSSYCNTTETGYYMDANNLPVSCSSGTIVGCGVCSGSTTCSSAATGYVFDQNNALATCVSLLDGCTACSDYSTCTSCDTSAHFQPIGAATSCSCATGYLLSNHACNPCSNTLTGCSQCDNTGCTQCNSQLHFTAGITGDTCDCDSGYFLDGSSCVLCSSRLTGCTQCSSGSACTACASTYGLVTANHNCSLCSALVTYCTICSSENVCTTCTTGYLADAIGHCQTCDYFMTGCSTCSSETFCTAVLNNQYALHPSNDGTFYLCSHFMPGCLNCTDSTYCDVVNATAHYSVYYGNIGCLDGYTLDISSVCQTCAYFMTGCTLCTSRTYCLATSTGYFVDASGTPIACSQGCLNCTSLTACTLCDYGSNFLLNSDGTGCGCLLGMSYNASTHSCSNVCGDGQVFMSLEACDDGNLNNYDGCSSSCTLESNYSCFAYPGEASLCSYSGALSLSLQSATKTADKNQVTMKVKIYPNLASLGTLDFKQVVATSDPRLSNPRYEYSSDGYLVLKYDYSQTLEGDSISFSINPAKTSHLFFAIPESNISVSVSSPSMPFVYKPESQYQTISKVESLSKAVVAASYVILGVGLVSNKVIGLQFLGAVQIAYFAQGSLDVVPDIVSPLAKMSSVNGVNTQYVGIMDTVPTGVANLGLYADFISNFNYMMWVTLGSFAAGVVVASVGALLTGPYSPKLLKAGIHMTKEYLFTVSMFNSLNVAYSAGLQFAYGSSKTDSILAGVCLATTLGAGVATVVAGSAGYSEFKSDLKSTTEAKSYFLVSIVYRMVLGLALSYLNSSDSSVGLAVMLSIFFAIYQLSSLPYKKGYHNYRAIADQFSIIITLVSASYYRFIGDSGMSPQEYTSTSAPGLATLGGLGGAAAVTVVCLAYDIYGKVKQLFKKLRSQAKPKEAQKQGQTQEMDVDAGNQKGRQTTQTILLQPTIMVDTTFMHL